LIRRVLLLATVFLLVALATSRVALVGHELVGHGLVAVGFGADLVSYKLFLFGGGWVTYRWPSGPPGEGVSMAVAMGGIALEAVAGTVSLVVAARCRGTVARIAWSAVATILLLHAGFYLAAGTHHGFGDGRAVQEALGAWRPLLVVPVSLAVVAGGFWLARRLAAEVASSVAGTPMARAGQIAAAAVLAAAAHGALTYGERLLTRDETYAHIMEHEDVRLVARDVGRFAIQVRQAQGRAPTAEEMAAARARFEAEHRVFPLAPLLGILLGLACLAGLWVAVRRDSAPPRDPAWRFAQWPAVVCAAAITLVAVLQFLAP
jgi:hypothetical protein